MIEFEWDPDKAVVDQTKQGVTFEEARTIFGDPFGFTVLVPRRPGAILKLF